MDFIEKINAIASKVFQYKDTIETEEETKIAFVLPFISALGYDIFNPFEVKPEYSTDIGGIKKGEKIDYCILKNGKPIIIIECKHINDNLKNHDNQLHRYFYATNAKFAILTNGIKYRFYTDSENANRMDDKPFWEFDITKISKESINELVKYQKSVFDSSQIAKTAVDLKLRQHVKQIMKHELKDPSDNFVRFFAGKIHSGTLTKKIIEQYRGIIKKSLNQLLTESPENRITDLQKPTTEKTETKKKTNKTRKSKIERPKKIMIGNDSYSISKSLEILTITAEWLISKGNLTTEDCPVSTGHKKHKRNLVNTIPKHKNNVAFRAPKRLSNGLYIETHYSKFGCIINAQRLLEKYGFKKEKLIIE